MLLGLVAAERGHTVLLGDFRALLSHRHWLPPGIFHDKALVPSRHRIEYRARLIDAGFLITSQDEEHGLLDPSFDVWANSRFSLDSLTQASRAFAWGDTDAEGLRRNFPDAADRVQATGSPRVDMWRPELAGLYPAEDLKGVKPGFVLIPTNLGIGRPNAWWDQIADLRLTSYRGDDDPAEWAMYDETAYVVAYAGRLVRALRAAAKRHPEVQFVVRPHHEEGAHGWRAVLGPTENISVIRTGSVTPWIRHARLVVHNGSTTGLEAAVAGVPLAAFLPAGLERDYRSNSLGRTVVDADGLAAAVEEAMDPLGRERWFTARDHRILRDLLSGLEGRLAVDRIVDEWESLRTGPEHQQRIGVRSSLAAAGLHRGVGRARTALRRSMSDDRFRPTFATAHKFPPLRRSDIERMIGRMKTTLDRFARVRWEVVGPRLIRLRSR